MSILNELASAHKRRDEDLNQQLASRLCQNGNIDETQEHIQELVDNLHHKNKQIRSDCIKVLYEIGAVKPDLIDIYVEEFVDLLSHKDNRLVWGAMTALGSIASRKIQEVAEYLDVIIDATLNGSVITQDWGVRVLTTLAQHNQYSARLIPILIGFLENCRPKDVPRHAESIMIAINTLHSQAEFRRVLEQHQSNLKPSQLKRVNKVLQQL